MIQLKDIRWGWVFSYGDNNELKLNEHQIVQLVGKNGFGKSSIPLIIEECFFNKNSKGTKRADVLNRNSNSKQYWIEGVFDKDGIEYRVKTIRGGTVSVKLLENNVDISSHTATNTYKRIEEILGFDSKTFSQLIYQSSSSSLEFLTATDTNRKKFLISLLNLDAYVEAFEIFKILSKDLNDEVTKLETKIQTVQHWLDENSKIDLIKKELLDIPQESADDKLEETTLLSEQIKTIVQTNKRITQNNQYKKLLNDIPVEQLGKVLYKPNSDTNYIKEQTELAKDIRDAKIFISKMGNLSDTCPTCKQSVDNTQSKQLVNEKYDIIEKANNRIKELISLCAEIVEKQNIYNRIIKYQTDFEEYYHLIDNTLQEDLLDKQDIENRIIQLNQEVLEIRSRISSITTENNKRIQHNSKVDVVSEQIVKMNSDILSYSEQLQIVSHQLKLTQLLQKTFSTNGLIAYKIECLVKDLQNETNQYLAELSGGRFQISFVVSSSDKLNVIITDNGTDIDISALSSGERARVNTATLLAIRKIMQTLSKNKVNLLILDETIDNLDIDGKEKLIEVLMKEEYLNTILISHGYSHPLLEKIVIIKENNISRIE